MDTLEAVVAAAALKLRRGGILVIETPDPANILMASHHFWNDPTHQRPIPQALMEFIFQYFGFAVVRRLALNPFPPEDQLTCTEIEPVGKVNELLYGPRDYGLLGRREY
jgi:O-antigen chain-terminating methyltransferase